MLASGPAHRPGLTRWGLTRKKSAATPPGQERKSNGLLNVHKPGGQQGRIRKQSETHPRVLLGTATRKSKRHSTTSPGISSWLKRSPKWNQPSRQLHALPPTRSHPLGCDNSGEISSRGDKGPCERRSSQEKTVGGRKQGTERGQQNVPQLVACAGPVGSRDLGTYSQSETWKSNV